MVSAGADALDMTDLTNAEGERGLLGLAITKDGSLAYVDYTNNDGDTRIDEYAVNADGTFDKSTRREVLGFDQPYPNHNGGDVVFGPDGMLYIGTGDGGSGGDPDRRALNMSEWLGKILRIDPHASGGAAVHSAGRQSVRRGRRRQAGDLVVRPAQPVEVQLRLARPATCGSPTSARASGRKSMSDGLPMVAAAGSNFGWSAFEGNHRFNDDQSADGVTPPIHEYEHVGQDCSISGSALYRGAAIPALVGWYVFADYCSGQVRALQIADRAEVKQVGLGRVASVVSINEGPDGELYVLSNGGGVYSVTPA